MIDFVPGEDRIQLSDAGFNGPDLFHTSTVPGAHAGSTTGGASVIVYDGTGGQANPGVYYDQDGTSTGYSVPVLALLPVGSPAGAGDIILA